jgi:hypothetical protein
MRVKIIEWKNCLIWLKRVRGGGGEWEAVRRAWLWVSIRARERRKERNVRGAMNN